MSARHHVPTCEACGLTAGQMPAAAAWADVPLEDAACCQVDGGLAEYLSGGS